MDVTLKPTGTSDNARSRPTDRQAQAVFNALNKSEEWLSAVFAASRDGVVLEANGRIVQANETCARMLGYSAAEEMIGRSLTLFAADADVKRMLDFAHRPQSGNTSELFTFTARKKDGFLVQLEASVGSAPLAGEPHGVLLLRDITARISLEAQYRQSQKMEAVGQLASGVAHDFNNLLTAIRCQTETILAYEPISPTTREMLQQVVSATQRAADLTRQLMTFSRRQPMQAATIELNTLLGNLTRMLKHLITEEIELQHELAPNLPPLNGDSGMIEQVIINLVINARDAMPRGGRLKILAGLQVVNAEYVFRQPTARAGEFIVLAVTDTGSGIAPETLPRIFEPFFTTKEVGKGTGLGLATVSGIVQQHEGWIEVESKLGEGTTFKVFLPARRDLNIVASKQADQPAPISVGNECLLLVEDDSQLRKLMRATMQKFGYRMFDAASSVEALTIWEQHADEIQLVLSDLVLPQGMSGWELVKKLRERKPQLRAILTSGYNSPLSDEELKTMPDVSFISKPFDPQSLGKMVRQALDKAAPDQTRP